MGTTPFPKMDFPGAPQYNLQQNAPGGQYTPAWTLADITAALNADIYNQQRVYDILQQLPNITYDLVQPIPFTGSANDQNIQNTMSPLGESFLITAAQCDVSAGKVNIKAQSLTMDLMQNPALITAIAGQSSAVSPEIAWPQPLLVPASTVLQFNWFNSTTNPQSAGNLTLKGRIIKSTDANDAPLIQELYARLMNIPFWIDVPVAFTGQSLENVNIAFQGISNPLIIVGAQQNIPNGLVQPYVQSLGQDVTQTPIPMKAWAYTATNINPIRYFPQPFVIPPNTVMKFNNINAAGGAAQLAGDIVLIGRVLRQQMGN